VGGEHRRRARRLGYYSAWNCIRGSARSPDSRLSADRGWRRGARRVGALGVHVSRAGGCRVLQRAASPPRAERGARRPLGLRRVGVVAEEQLLAVADHSYRRARVLGRSRRPSRRLADHSPGGRARRATHRLTVRVAQLWRDTRSMTIPASDGGIGGLTVMAFESGRAGEPDPPSRRRVDGGPVDARGAAPS